MPMILLGLGYLLLAAAGAACWGLALAGSRRGDGSAFRTTSLLVAGALAALAARAVVVWLLALPDPGFAQEKAVVGLPVSAVTSILAAVRGGCRATAGPCRTRRDGITAGAFAAAAAAAGAEVVLTIAVGAPAGPAAALVVARGRRRDGGCDGARPHPAFGRIPSTRRRRGSGIRRRDRRASASSRS